MIQVRHVPIGISKLKYVFHLSDIHIRNFKRHAEYRRVFDTTKNIINSYGYKDSVILITGDIVHSKNDVTPELVQEVQQLLKSLSEVHPVIVTAGNHDANLNNPNRLDTLSPIINAIDSDRIHYLRDNGVYQLADKQISVWSVFDKFENYIKASELTSDFKMATFHGPVANSKTEIGYTLSHESIKVEDFSGFDVVFLGDIHKRQVLSTNPAIAYPGSLIQQNHAESIQHGFILWDLESRNMEFVDVPNDTAYVTIQVDGINNSIQDIESLQKSNPSRLYLRLKHKNSNMFELKNIVNNMRQSYKEIVEVSYQQINDFDGDLKENRKLSILDTRELNYQNKLISDHLREKYSLSESTIKEVCEINKNINGELKKLDRSRNVMWIPKKFHFSNMFSYGEDNCVDFTDMSGVIGLFAPNASGKSTLLDAISFCIFDKCSRTSKGSQVLNNQSDSFYCKLEFELDGNTFFIQRDAIKQKNGNVRVDVNFWMIDESGKEINLNGKERSDTNNNIRNYLGTYEDFVLTTLSSQSSNSGFIDMNQRDRKDLLSQFLDIGVFEELFNVANSEMKEVSVLVKDLQRHDYKNLIDKYTSEILCASTNLGRIDSDRLALESSLLNYESKLIEEVSKLNKIDIDVEDLDSLIIKEHSTSTTVETLSSQLQNSKETIKKWQADLKAKNKLLKDVDLVKLDQNLVEYQQKEKEHTKLSIEVYKSSVTYKSKKEKLDKLKDLEYDYNCKYCMNNVFVKDAIHTSSSFCEIKKEYEQLNNQFETLSLELNSYEKYTQLKKSTDVLVSEIKDLESIISLETSNCDKIKLKLQDTKNYLKDIKSKISFLHKRSKQIEENKLLEVVIKDIKDNISKTKVEIDHLNSEKVLYTSALRVAESSKISTENDLKRLSELEDKYKNYQYYLDAVHRDGVPHMIISTVIPKIEEEINNILNQLVDFRVILQSDDKNINAYIAYDENRFWPIELTSGMEKFIASLAIRTSLMNISTLPRPNFIAIDEGFGSLDQSNLGNISLFFEYLKSQFKFILIISHIDSMRDIVDHLIEIHKKDGRSSVQHP